VIHVVITLLLVDQNLAGMKEAIEGNGNWCHHADCLT